MARESDQFDAARWSTWYGADGHLDVGQAPFDIMPSDHRRTADVTKVPQTESVQVWSIWLPLFDTVPTQLPLD